MLINRQNLTALFTGYKQIFQEAFEGTPSQWSEVAMEVPSSTSQEVYPWLGASTQFREWVGDRVIQNLKTHDFSIKNKSWESTIAVNRDQIEDDQFGVYRPMIGQMGQDARRHPDLLVFAALKAGDAQLCYDGQYFFDTDHPVGSGTASNHGGGAGAGWYLLDTSRAIKPLIYQVRKPYNFQAFQDEADENVFKRREFVYGIDARSNVGYGLWQLAYFSKQALDATNYQAARVAMMERKNDMGMVLGIKPTVLLVPPSLEKSALELVQAERLANGADNVLRGTTRVVSCPWLV